MKFTKIIFCTVVLLMISSCKSRNPSNSTMKDVGFSDGGGRPKEVFRLVNSDVVYNACVYEVNSFNSIQNVAEACQFSEAKIPFAKIEHAIKAQLENRSGSNDIEQYKSIVSKELAVLSSQSKMFTDEIGRLEAEKSKDQSKGDTLTLQIESIKSNLGDVKLRHEYYATAFSMVDDLTSENVVNQSSIVEYITKKLLSTDITIMRQDQKVLFPLNFYISIWDTEREGTLRSIKERLKEKYATATPDERKEIALSYASGPIFRNAWWSVYGESANGINSPYFNGLNNIKNDQSRRIKSSGKTFVFAAEKYTSLPLQTVSDSVAEGFSGRSN